MKKNKKFLLNMFSILFVNILICSPLLLLASCSRNSNNIVEPEVPPIDPSDKIQLKIVSNDGEKINLASSLLTDLSSATTLSQWQLKYDNYANNLPPTSSSYLQRSISFNDLENNNISWNEAVERVVISPSSTNLQYGKKVPPIQIRISIKNKYKASTGDLSNLSFDITDLGNVMLDPSVPSTPLNITRKDFSPSNLSIIDLVNINSTSTKNKVKSLGTLFNGITSENILKFNIEIILDSSNASSMKWKINLIAKPNYHFGLDKRNIHSNPFNYNLVEESYVEGTPGTSVSTKEEFLNYIRENKNYSLNKNSFVITNAFTNFHDDKSTFFKFIDNFPKINDSNLAVRLFRQKVTSDKAFFSIRVHPINIIGDINSILQIPELKNADGSTLLISVGGYASKESVSTILQSIYKKELDYIIDDINLNGLIVNSIGRNSFVDPTNADNYNLNQWIDFKHTTSIINSNRKIVYDFSDISFNQQTGLVKSRINAYVKDNNYRLGDSTSLHESKISDLISFNVKPNINFRSDYNLQSQQQKPKINRSKLDSIIYTSTNNNKKNYFPHKISREQIVSSIDNYDSKPNNVFLDYDANADNGKLIVRLIERDFGNWDKYIERYPNYKISDWKEDVESIYDPQIIDKVLDTYEVSGFKTWQDVTILEREGMNSFKEWYAFKRSFIFNISYEISGLKYKPNNDGSYSAVYEGNDGIYGIKDEDHIGTGWIANKINDTEFIFATNSHVAENLPVNKDQNNDWYYNNWNYNYKENIILRQIEPTSINNQRTSTVTTVEVNPKTNQIISEAPKSFNDWFYNETKYNHRADEGLLTYYDQIESIKLDSIYGRDFFKINEPKTQILETSNAYVKHENNLSDNRFFNISNDIAFFRIKFKSDAINNPFNEIWEEIGPTSISPVDDLVFTSIGDVVQFNNQKNQKVWNNFSTSGYPAKDRHLNPNGDYKNHFIYKGDGGKNQSNQNDFLQSRVDLNQTIGYTLNTFDVDIWQTDNEGSFGGSSGSPIFDKNMNIIAILYGGIIEGIIPDPNDAYFMSGNPLWMDLNTRIYRYTNGASYTYGDSDGTVYKQKHTNYNMSDKIIK